MSRLHLHEDRLFPSDDATRSIARRLLASIEDVPIISPHGHTDPAWFAYDRHFDNPADLLITPDHYVLRMLYSQGVSLERLGVSRIDGEKTSQSKTDPREIWRVFAAHYHLFIGTPTQIWHDWVYSKVFGLSDRLTHDTADTYYDQIADLLRSDDFRPRELFKRFNIEVISTTEDPLDLLVCHQKLIADGWGSKVRPSYRPDNVLDPEYPGFKVNLDSLAEITGCDTMNYQGYLRALENRRAYFRAHGATATDHGHPSAFTASLNLTEAETLFERVRHHRCSPKEAELFRGHMLVEMARMSAEDGMTMQIHAGCSRNHNRQLFERFGRDKGGDIPLQTDYVTALGPLLDRFGNDETLTIILFTLDETTYSRELAPLAGVYPALKLGPPWWFHDSPEGLRRFRENVTETAGFYNTVGFNDDTRGYLSIPARHDVARRMDCSFLARLIAEHRMTEDDGYRVIRDLSYNLAKSAYNL